MSARDATTLTNSSGGRRPCVSLRSKSISPFRPWSSGSIQGAISRRGFKPRKQAAGRPDPMALLPEIGEKPSKSMDEAGVTMQVLSPGGPGPDLVPGPDGVAIAREVNDHLAAAVPRIPTRFAGFAALPLASPEACAAELRALRQGAALPRRADQRHDRRPLPRSSELRRFACGRGRARRADLHPSAPAAAVGARGVLRRPAGRRGPRARDRRLGLAFGGGDPGAAHGARRHARQASEAQADHRPHGRDAAGHARPRRSRSPRSTSSI